MPSAARFPYRPAARALAAALAFHAAGAAANPQGGVVKAGSAAITATGNRLDVVQSSQRAVIDWRGFSIGAGEQVKFSQPSAASATLNRVTGAEVSSILGRLSANGTVFLLNPNGILIGPGAKIDVGGLVATTANISNENFMAGRLKFDEVVNRNAVIVNRGEITAAAGGLVALVAPGVENSGVIRAELGRVALASGNAFTLDLFGDRLVAFAVDDKVAARLTDMDGRPLKAYVNQSGTIDAGGGSILIAASAAKSVLDNVINTSGVVRATTFAQRAGEIVLTGGDEGVVRVAGTLDASGRAAGATGGSVKVLGAEVVLDPGSRVDVSGDAGGGTTLVGGGVQGGGGIPRSLRTTIEGGASIAADAITRGNGGTIVAWSDGETRFAGALSARAGVAGGDGGFVEVSGKRALSFGGAVDLGAPAGKGGRLLLDPDSMIVDAATATAIAAVLRAGVGEVKTVADTIDVRQPIDGRFGAPGGGLTLEAGNAITVSNDIVTNDGPVVLRAGAGGIAMNAGPATSVTGGNGTMIHAGTSSIELRAVGNVTAEHLLTSGPVTVTSDAAGVRLNRDLAGPGGNGIGSLAASAARSVELKGVKTTAEVSVATTKPGGTITLEGPIVAGGNVTIGRSALAGQTTIRLRNDVYAQGADIELNGRTWIAPIARPDNVILQEGPPFFSRFDGTLFDAPAVQLAVQTTGFGNVRFNGDVLWDGSSLPSARYLYNTPQPAGFDRGDPAAVAALRAQQPLRPVPFYGLHVGVDGGEVSFAGNVGTFDAGGASVGVLPPIGSLGAALTGNGLAITLTGPLGSFAASFNGAKSVEATRVVSVFNDPAAPFVMEVEAPDFFASPPGGFALLPGKGAPLVEIDGGNPNLVGPSPRNVLAAPGAERVAALPDVPLVPVPERFLTLPPTVAGTAVPAPDLSPPPEVAGTGAAALNDRAVSQVREGATRAESRVDVPGEDGGALDPARSADIGRGGAARGAAPDVFGLGAPLAPVADKLSTGADTEYFSQGAFEFLRTQSERGSR